MSPFKGSRWGGQGKWIEEERNRSSVKIQCQTASTSFLPANLTLFNEKHELNCCFDDFSIFFPLRWTWKPNGIYSFATLQEKALGQKWIMSSSPGVSQQVMLIRRADSKLACYLPRVVLSPLGWLAGVCILLTCPPHSTDKLLLSKGFWSKGKEEKNLEYSKQFIIFCLFVHLWYKGFTCCLGE